MAKLRIISKIFSETARLMIAKFYVEPPWVRGMKIYMKGFGHMTKMAVCVYMVKNIQKSFPEPLGQFLRNLVCSIWYSSPSDFTDFKRA